MSKYDKITEDREERNPIAKLKKAISNITSKIKGLFGKTEIKQLPERTENVKNDNKLDGLKVKLLSEMSNDEINKIMEDMRKDPWGSQQYEDEQILEEVFKRIGTDDELAKLSAENNMVNQIWACHRMGRLVTKEDGTTEYYDEYTNEKGSYRTTIGCEDGVVTVDNKQYLDKEGNDVDVPQYYNYYMGDIDARVTNQVRISKNDFGGITLENDEKNGLDQLDFDATSTIEFDSNNIEVKKIKNIFEKATTILERTENPLVLKETYQSGSSEPLIMYYSVEKMEPDKLYSTFYTCQNSVGSPEQVKTINLSNIAMKELCARNPKAAKYFESLGREEQEKEVNE